MAIVVKVLLRIETGCEDGQDWTWPWDTMVGEIMLSLAICRLTDGPMTLEIEAL